MKTEQAILKVLVEPQIMQMRGLFTSEPGSTEGQEEYFTTLGGKRQRITARYKFPMGALGSYEQEIWWALESLIGEHIQSRSMNESNRSFKTSLLEIRSRMAGGAYNGSKTKRMREALKKLAHTIITISLFWDKKDKVARKWVTFPLLSMVACDSKGGRNTVEIELSRPVFRNFKSKYYYVIDHTMLMGLKTSIGRRLYERLARHFWATRNKEDDSIQYRYLELAKMIGFAPQSNRYRAVKRLEKAHKELVDFEVLDYEPDIETNEFTSERGNWMIHYTPGDKAFMGRTEYLQKMRDKKEEEGSDGE